MSKQVNGIGFIGTGEVSLLHAKAIKSIPTARLVGSWRLESMCWLKNRWGQL
jgi:hypothetical protein